MKERVWVNGDAIRQTLEQSRKENSCNGELCTEACLEYASDDWRSIPCHLTFCGEKQMGRQCTKVKILCILAFFRGCMGDGWGTSRNRPLGIDNSWLRHNDFPGRGYYHWEGNRALMGIGKENTKVAKNAIECLNTSTERETRWENYYVRMTLVDAWELRMAGTMCVGQSHWRFTGQRGN